MQHQKTNNLQQQTLVSPKPITPQLALNAAKANALLSQIRASLSYNQVVTVTNGRTTNCI